MAKRTGDQLLRGDRVIAAEGIIGVPVGTAGRGTAVNGLTVSAPAPGFTVKLGVASGTADGDPAWDPRPALRELAGALNL